MGVFSAFLRTARLPAPTLVPGILLTLLNNFQRHIMPAKIKYWKEEDMEWFFHKDIGILGIDGKKKKDPKVCRNNFFN